MIGVNILGQELEVSYNPLFRLMIGVGLIFFVIYTILFVADILSKKKNICAMIIAIVGLVTCYAGCYLKVNNIKIEYIKYYATIEEDVKWKDFVSKYEVLRKVGDLYVLKETPEQNS